MRNHAEELSVGALGNQANQSVGRLLRDLRRDERADLRNRFLSIHSDAKVRESIRELKSSNPRGTSRAILTYGVRQLLTYVLCLDGAVLGPDFHVVTMILELRVGDHACLPR